MFAACQSNLFELSAADEANYVAETKLNITDFRCLLFALIGNSAETIKTLFLRNLLNHQWLPAAVL